MKFRCPACKCTFTAKEKTFPFCSEQCQNADLGKWATESYAIPAIDPPSEHEVGSDRTSASVDEEVEDYSRIH